MWLKQTFTDLWISNYKTSRCVVSAEEAFSKKANPIADVRRFFDDSLAEPATKGKKEHSHLVWF